MLLKKFRNIIAGLVMVTILTSCEEISDNDDAATTHFINGKIYTVNEAAPWATTLAVKDGKILYVGNDRDQVHVNAETEVIDLQGKMMLPGFVDSHSHLLTGAARWNDLILDPSDTPDIWIEQIKTFAEANPERNVVTAIGYFATAFGMDGPNRHMLDDVVPDRPVIVLDEGMHTAWLNTMALERLSIDRNTPDPDPGLSYYKRDENGEPTGYLLESTSWTAGDELAMPSLEQMVKNMSEVIELYNSYGVTTVFGAGPWFAKKTQYEIIQGLSKTGALTLRYKGSQYMESRKDKDTIVAEVLALKKQTEGQDFSIDTVKIMLDGTVEGMTAALFDPYQGGVGNRGMTTLEQDELNTLVNQAVGADLDVHFHALGDRAVAMSLDAVAAARERYPNTDRRFTIAHMQIVRDEDVPRFAELEVVAQTSLIWLSDDEFTRATLQSEQHDRSYPLATLNKLGARTTFGVDFPSHGGGLEGVAPLYNIEVGMNRQSPGEPDQIVLPKASERLDLKSLIKGYTINGAWQMRLEYQVGSLEAGKLADLVVIDENIFAAPKYSIHDIDVLQTWLGGKLVYENPAPKTKPTK